MSNTPENSSPLGQDASNCPLFTNEIIRNRLLKEHVLGYVSMMHSTLDTHDRAAFQNKVIRLEFVDWAAEAKRLEDLTQIAAEAITAVEVNLTRVPFQIAS